MKKNHQSPPRLGSILFGSAQLCLCTVRLNSDRLGSARLGRIQLCSTRLAVARLGSTRLASARLCSAPQGKERPGTDAKLGSGRIGPTLLDWFGSTQLCSTRFGSAYRGSLEALRSDCLPLGLASIFLRSGRVPITVSHSDHGPASLRS